MARSQLTEDQVRDEDFLSEEEALTLSGSLQTQIDAKPDNFLELDDTPSVYDAGKVLQSTTSGVVWATVSGAGGTSFHSELYELDYASSGHTGFSPEIHDHTFIDLTDTPTTYSGYRGYYARVTESGTLALEFDDLTDKIAAYGGGIILYPNDTDSDISGYKNIRAYPVDEPETSDFVITSTKGLIQEFVTSSGIDAVIIPAGKWVFNIYASTSSSSQINTVEVEVYLRDTVGTETLMFSEETSPLLYGVATLYRILVIIPNDTPLADNERLVFKFYGVNYSGGAKTITLYYQGNTSYTHIDTPLSSIFLTEHTELLGLNDYDDHPRYLDITRGDERYYTETEVDTISGTLQDHIDAKPDNFLELDDTPSSYDGGKHVKSTTSGIEFDYTTFLELSDTPTTYSGASQLPLVTKVDESGVEFGLIPETAISGTYFISYEGGRLLRGATGNRPDLVYLGPVAGLAFDAGKTESAYGSFKIPYSWYESTNIELKINYMNDDAQTGVKTCAWKLAFHAYQEGEFYSDKTLTILDISTDLPSDVAAGRYTTETLDIPYDDADNPLSIGDTVTFQFYRDGSSDDMSGDAILISLSFEMKTGDLSQLAG